MTFDEVIEEHRKLIGADKFHVTLGPKSTPENLREELRKLRDSMIHQFVSNPPHSGRQKTTLNSGRCPECGELHENCDPDGVGHYRG